jgi:hypothetical protein
MWPLLGEGFDMQIVGIVAFSPTIGTSGVSAERRWFKWP